MIGFVISKGEGSKQGPRGRVMQSLWLKIRATQTRERVLKSETMNPGERYMGRGGNNRHKWAACGREERRRALLPGVSDGELRMRQEGWESAMPRRLLSGGVQCSPRVQ